MADKTPKKPPKKKSPVKKAPVEKPLVEPERRKNPGKK